MIYDCSSSQSCDSASCSYFHTQHFYNPLYSPTTLQILQILQLLQSYRHLTDNVPAHFVHRTIVQPAQGPRYFFVHLAQVAASLRSAGRVSGGGRPGEFRAAGGRESFGRRAAGRVSGSGVAGRVSGSGVASRAHACKLREDLGGGRPGEFRGGGRLRWKSGGVRSGGPRVAGRRLEI